MVSIVSSSRGSWVFFKTKFCVLRASVRVLFSFCKTMRRRKKAQVLVERLRHEGPHSEYLQAVVLREAERTAEKLHSGT